MGCSKISAGCQNCYAEKMARRLATMHRPQYESVMNQNYDPVTDTVNFNGWNGATAFVPAELGKPDRWKKSKSIFVGSMGDTFHETVDDEDLNSIMEMTMCCPQHTFIFLTKRPWIMFEYFRDFPYALKNVMLGVSVEDQQTANERIPILLKTPASKRFISLEPMLGPVDLTRLLMKRSDAPERGKPDVTMNSLTGWHGGANRPEPTRLDGIILGGESGPKARPLDPDWVRQVRDQCSGAGIPFMFKQGFGEKFPTCKSTGLPKIDGCAHPELAW